MKTNVIFKSGLNLVCDVVSIYETRVYLYKNNLTPSCKIELMNACMSNDWECSDNGDASLRICVKKNTIEQFKVVL